MSSTGSTLQAERERIARDIHDTLLQGTQALLFRLQIWEDHPEIPDSLRKEIAVVIQHTHAIVAEGRERILKMRQAAPADLPDALAAIGHEASAGSGAAFNVSVTGAPRSLDPDTRDQLTQLAREAVRNAHRHADARRISISLRYRRLSLLLAVVDDGCGFDPAAVEGGRDPTHFGLVGIRERAAQLGGHLRIDSRPGSGTRIEVVVPLEVEKPTIPRQGHGMGAIIGTELGQNALYPGLDGLFRYIERSSDVAVGLTAGNELHDAQFSRSQPVLRVKSGSCRGEPLLHHDFTFQHPAQR